MQPATGERRRYGRGGGVLMAELRWWDSSSIEAGTTANKANGASYQRREVHAAPPAHRPRWTCRDRLLPLVYNRNTSGVLHWLRQQPTPIQ